MKYCSECGSELINGAKFCSECGKTIANQKETDITNDDKRMKCPYCGSNNISVQVVTRNKRTNFFVVLLYIFLAISLLGWLILIPLLLRGKKTVTEKCYICQGCGATLNPRQLNGGTAAKSNGASQPKKSMPKPLKIVLISLAGFFGTIILISVIASMMQDTNFVNYDQYVELNPQELYNDYVSDVNTASQKYGGYYYYYFNGVVEEQVDATPDDYLLIDFISANGDEKVFHINAFYFLDSSLSKLKKGDDVTLYCKFNNRDVDNNFVFRSCRTKK